MSGLAGISLGAKLLGVRKKLASVPWQVWVGLAIIAALVIGVIVHGNKVEAFGKEQYDAGYADGTADRDAEIKALQDAKAEAERKLAEVLRRKVNEENARIDARGDALRLSGPGKAASCPNPPAASPGAGGHNEATAEADDARAGVPSEQWASVPWGWLVKKAEDHDKCLIEAGAWREQKAAEIKAYEESKTDAP